MRISQPLMFALIEDHSDKIYTLEFFMYYMTRSFDLKKKRVGGTVFFAALASVLLISGILDPYARKRIVQI